MKFPVGAKVALATVLAAGTAVGGVGISRAYATDTVSFDIDGAKSTADVRSKTVAEALASQGVTLGEHDVVQPALDTEVAEGLEVSVKFGRPVTLTVDGKTETRWTTAKTLDQALAQFKIANPKDELSVNRSTPLGREGLKVSVDTAKTVTVKTAKGEVTVELVGTVGDALKAAKVTTDRYDEVSAKATDELTDNQVITVADIAARKYSKTSKIPFKTVTVEDSDLKKGTTTVATEGKQGSVTNWRTQWTRDGKQFADQLNDQKIVKPVNKVVKVGTKEEPKPVVQEQKTEKAETSTSAKKSTTSTKRSTTSTTTTKRSTTSAPSVASGSVWDRLAQCESGGNWAINTGNGFYGGLQFTLQTWRGFGGSGMPHHASREQQIAIAKKVQATQGWGAWPACTSKLGIR